MRKLKLDVESLEVTSFETADEGEKRGTVAGRLNQEVDTNASAEWVNTCAPNYTCGSCAGTCAGTCDGGVCGSHTACALCLIN